MTSTGRQKALILFLAGIFIVSVFVLAASLSRVKFRPGTLFKPSTGPSTKAPGGDRWLGFSDRWMDIVNKALWALVTLLFILVALFAILFPEYRKELLITALVTATLGAIVWYAFFHLRLDAQEMEPWPRPEAELGEGPVEVPVSPITVPNWSPFLFISVGLAILAFLSWRFLPLLIRRESPLPEIAGLAGEAASKIRAGADVKNVVLRCYRDMSSLLSDRQGILPEQARTMTTREFELRLHKAGVRDQHVSLLSRLFELVRYGGRKSRAEEEQAAIECLEAIEQAYGGQ